MTQPDSGHETDSGLEDLLVFIRDSRGFDFTGYKRSTVTRRISKRMHEAGATDYTDYRDRLESSAEEFGHLFNTILINVTGFFRDAETWAFLRREIMPELIADYRGHRRDPGVERRLRQRRGGLFAGDGLRRGAGGRRMREAGQDLRDGHRRGGPS